MEGLRKLMLQLYSMQENKNRNTITTFESFEIAGYITQMNVKLIINYLKKI